MHPEVSLSKRIKRHVIGRTRRYFIASPPGFETLCAKELASLPLGVQHVSVIPGGVEFKGRLDDCYLANLNVRTANRILLRLHAFKASNFKQLEKRLAEIPWELYLPHHSALKIRATVKHCRLYHTGAIEKHFRESIANGLAHTAINDGDGPDPASPQQIFVRGIDDRFTVSLDSSGDNLYKRGLKKHAATAPLRETLAAASLLLTGYSGKGPLVDPMCGAGTYSLEAALMVKKIPPGWFREFAFMRWPAYRPKRFGYLKRQFEDYFVQPEKPLIFASDKDPLACRQLEQCTRQFGLSDAVRVSNADFFERVPQDFTDQPGLVTINPPYGRRMGTRQESTELIQAICEKLAREYKGWKLVLIAPIKLLEKKVPFKLKTYPLFHGGLILKLMVGKIG
jgi:putative N6-adenine-specific DNA methylase